MGVEGCARAPLIAAADRLFVNLKKKDQNFNQLSVSAGESEQHCLKEMKGERQREKKKEKEREKERTLFLLLVRVKIIRSK